MRATIASVLLAVAVPGALAADEPGVLPFVLIGAERSSSSEQPAARTEQPPTQVPDEMPAAPPAGQGTAVQELPMLHVPVPESVRKGQTGTDYPEVTAYAYNADKSKAAENFEKLLQGLAPTLQAASQEVGGYQVDTIELHVVFTAEAGFRVIASGGVEGGIKLTFKRAPGSRPDETSSD